MRQFLRFRKCQKASVMVEAALILGSIAFILPGIIDIATVMNSSLKVQGAVRAGVQYALENPSSLSNVGTVINNASGLSGTITLNPATPATSCACGVTSAACGSTCADGLVAGTYATINASYSQSLIYGAFFASNPHVITRTVTFRVS